MGYWSELKSWLFKDPAKLIRYVVLFVCSIVVIVQLYECFQKLDNPPISTHSYFSINESIEMPAVTICREPPYKEDILSNISGGNCAHPRFNTCWVSYPYGEVDLSEFLINSTFTADETFDPLFHALNGLKENVEITSSIQFYRGRCHTVRPRIPLKRVNINSGYSLLLRHHFSQEELKRSMEIDEIKPGWHVYIHDTRENFTEIQMSASGRVEYIYAGVEEEIEIKLHAQQFSNIASKQKSCLDVEGYSDLKCSENCIWKQLEDTANCTGPWMHDSNIEQCSSYKSMLQLTGQYSCIYDSEDEPKCDCIPPCDSRLFTTYIQNRKAFSNPPHLSTQIYIYYTTKLVSMMQERPSYDTTQFIAEVGGSLGFLLGLSVLGLIGIVEHITLWLCGGIMKKMQLKHEKRLKISEDLDKTSQNSTTTLDIATLHKEKV